MPPVKTKKSDGPQTIQKDVEFVAKDADEQVATGIVMVPDKVDLQNDFVREDQIREFAEQFENFEAVGEAGGGIMHAVFPDDWLDLERNEVLEEPETIGGETAPAGAWVQSWGYNNDDLWELVEDGTLAGYSVGIDGVRWDGPYEQDDVEDVDVPAEIDEEELVWEIVEGIMREVSTVDIPAVPDAMILDKADAAKALREHLGNRDAFIEEAMDRGHDEAAAEQMWDVLNEAAELEGAGEPGEKSFFERIGKSVMSALSGPDDSGMTHTAETPDEDPRDDVAKEGRTLSRSNRESAMAAVDANLDILEDAGVDHGMTRFTDQDSVDFDLSEHDAREWSGDGGEGEPPDDEDEDEEAEADDKHASDGETSGDDTTDMSNDDEGGDEKSLAEKNAEQIEDLTAAVGELTEAVTGSEDKTTEIELNGETYEVRESDLRAALDDEGGADGEAGTLEEEIKSLHDRIDAIAEQSGLSGESNQIRRSTEEQEEQKSGLDSVGEALS
jgi:hypothetical protein